LRAAVGTVLIDPGNKAAAHLFSDLDFEAGPETRVELLRRADQGEAAPAAAA
jgi:hypothetical protein